MVVTRSRVQDVTVAASGFDVKISGTDDSFACRNLVNAAGLTATALARHIDGLAIGHVPDINYAIGHYFTYPGKSPFRHLIYPVPIDGGLGIHATNDLAGNVRFGPDVEWVDSIDYSFDSTRKDRFAEAISTYFPSLQGGKLAPAYTGIRPKLTGAGEAAADFLIQDESTHGIPGLVNLFGIESPGLTASLAIGDHVRRMLCGSG